MTTAAPRRRVTAADPAGPGLVDLDLPTASETTVSFPGDAPQPLAGTTRRLPRPVAALLKVPRLGTWSGLLVVAAGLVLIAVGWGDVAGTEDVGDQMPYVMSAGFTGLALVCIGATLVAIDAKLSDAKAHDAQLVALRDAIADLRSADEEAL